MLLNTVKFLTLTLILGFASAIICAVIGWFFPMFYVVASISLAVGIISTVLCIVIALLISIFED